MKVALGADHRGVDALRQVQRQLEGAGHVVAVMACPDGGACDYPDNAFEVGRRVGRGDADRGVLICGSGIGMSIAANKIEGVRAALVSDPFTAEMSRAHNDANVLCLSADLLEGPVISEIVDRWMNREFDGGRHDRRVRKIGAIERGEDPRSISD